MKATIIRVCVFFLLSGLIASNVALAQGLELRSGTPSGPGVEGPAGVDFGPGNIWDNGPANLVNGVASERDTQNSGTGGPEGDHAVTVADDFQIVSSTELTEIRVCLYTDVTEAELYIYEDDGGEPGPAVNAPLFGAPTTASIVSTTYLDNTTRCPLVPEGFIKGTGRQFRFNPATTGQAFPILNPGTYWLAVVGDGQGDTSTRAFWGTSSPSSPLSEGKMGSQPFAVPYWTDVSTQVASARDFAFDVDGGPGASRATFEVTKDFTDGNPGDVEVTISCNTGLPLEQSKLISEGEGVEFVVVEFDSGELDCEITETPVDGYDAEYFDGFTSNADSCEYLDVEWGMELSCRVTNTPAPVDVDVTKDWVIEGSSVPQGIDQRYELTLFCDAEIKDGIHLVETCESTEHEHASALSPACGVFATQDLPAGFAYLATWCKPFQSEGDDVFASDVIPEYPSSHCWVVETVYDDAAEVDNGCGNLQVSAGNGASCTITNTVFFEGIPTLNTYGKLLLALLMLGVGFVAFRRFA